MTAVAKLEAAIAKANAKASGPTRRVQLELHDAETIRAALSPAELGGVDAFDVFRIAGGDVECCPSPTAEQALECLRDLRQCYDELLSTPRDDEAGWLPTYGREPEGWRNHRLMFLCWEDGTVEASECYGSIAWEETTHWMPAKKPAKPSPPSPGAAK